MIDYGKLKKACDLCLKTGYSFSYFFGGKDESKYFGKDKIDDGFVLYEIGSGPIIDDYDNIDDLIAKLIELKTHDESKPNPKYKVGQTVWLCINGEIIECEVEQIYWDEDLEIYGVTLNIGKGNTCEDNVYPSKQALISAQIEYWRNLLNYEMTNLRFELPNRFATTTLSTSDLDMMDNLGRDKR